MPDGDGDPQLFWGEWCSPKSEDPFADPLVVVIVVAQQRARDARRPVAGGPTRPLTKADSANPKSKSSFKSLLCAQNRAIFECDWGLVVAFIWFEGPYRKMLCKVSDFCWGNAEMLLECSLWSCLEGIPYVQFRKDIFHNSWSYHSLCVGRSLDQSTHHFLYLYILIWRFWSRSDPSYMGISWSVRSLDQASLCFQLWSLTSVLCWSLILISYQRMLENGHWNPRIETKRFNSYSSNWSLIWSLFLLGWSLIP